MEKRCTHCGLETVPAWARFCDRCGQSFEQAPLAIVAQEPETDVTIMQSKDLAVAYKGLYDDMYRSVEIIQEDSLLWGVYGKHRTSYELKQEIRIMQRHSFSEIHEQELRNFLAFRQVHADDKLEREELARRLFRLMEALEQIERLAQGELFQQLAEEARRSFLEELVQDIKLRVLGFPPTMLPPE